MENVNAKHIDDRLHELYFRQVRRFSISTRFATSVLQFDYKCGAHMHTPTDASNNNHTHKHMCMCVCIFVDVFLSPHANIFVDWKLKIKFTAYIDKVTVWQCEYIYIHMYTYAHTYMQKVSNKIFIVISRHFLTKYCNHYERTNKNNNNNTEREGKKFRKWVNERMNVAFLVPYNFKRKNDKCSQSSSHLYTQHGTLPREATATYRIAHLLTHAVLGLLQWQMWWSTVDTHNKYARIYMNNL